MGDALSTITDSFDVDFGVNEWHGHNVFFGDSERVFRTYFVSWAGTCLGTRRKARLSTSLSVGRPVGMMYIVCLPAARRQSI